MLTSRPAAVAEGWLRREGFAEADLLPMASGDVRSFIRKWHEATLDQEPGAEQLGAYERTLTDAILTRRHLRALATSPLLCALLCALHRDRRSQLPRDQMELYQIALEMLLQRRDAERGIREGVALSRTQKTLILQDLAYWKPLTTTSDDRVRAMTNLVGRQGLEP